MITTVIDITSIEPKGQTLKTDPQSPTYPR